MVRKYNAASIDVPDPLQHVQRHPGMYLGDTDENGTLQCVKEILDNANDEMEENGGGRVLVRIKLPTILIADEGRGIPVDIHAKTKKSGLETVLTGIGAGGKSGAKTAYGGRTIGVHGVGASVVNALSSSFNAWSFRNGKWWCIKFAYGSVVKKLHRADPPIAWKCGTVIEFQVDTKILPAPLILKNVRYLCNIARHFLPVDIKYSDGEVAAQILERRKPSQLLQRIIDRDKLEITLGPVSINVDGVRLVAAWTNATDTTIQGHVSGAHVPSGTHIKGLEEAASQAMRSTFPREECSDPLIGLRAVIDVSVDQPSFSGQAKTTLKTPAARRQVFDATHAGLLKYIKANKLAAKVALEHAQRISKIDEQHKINKEMAKSADIPRGRLEFPKGFMAALSYPPHQRELYILEGKSAAGHARESKMPWQEVLPLRGKMANVINKKGAVQNSEIVGNILRCIGFDPRNATKPLRVGRIILLADADDDGCLAPDTRILTLDGRQPTIESLAKEWNKNRKPFWVWSRNSKGNLIPALAERPRITRRVKTLTRVHLDTGGYLDVTSDHELMLNNRESLAVKRDGHWYIEARHLLPGYSLSSTYIERRKLRKEHTAERNYLLEADMFAYHYVKKCVDPENYKWYVKHNADAHKGIWHIHHKNENALDDRPENLRFLRQGRHFGLHGARYSAEYNGSKKHAQDIAKFLTTPEGASRMKHASKVLTKYNKSARHSKTVAKLNRDSAQILLQSLGREARHWFDLNTADLPIDQTHWDTYAHSSNGSGKTVNWASRQFSIHEYKKHMQSLPHAKRIARKLVKITVMKQYPTQVITKFKSIATTLEDVNEITYEAARKEILEKTGCRGNPTWKYMKSKINPNPAAIILNHKVLRIEKINSDTDVYCMNVPKHENFFIADKNGNGVCSSNCHITVLLLTIIQRIMPSLLTEGRVYLVDAPLFEAMDRQGNMVAGNVLSDLEKEHGKLTHVNRMKGWGGCEVSLFKRVAFDPETRRLLCVDAPDKKENSGLLELMGADSAARKKLLDPPQRKRAK